MAAFRKIKDYLYEGSFDSLDYEAALAYFAETEEPENENEDPGTEEPENENEDPGNEELENENEESENLGGCSSIRNNNFFGRNYDWKYDEQNEYVVHTKASNGCYATVGVCSLVQNGESDDLIPFRILDGINERGLAVSVNVVPVTDESTEAVAKDSVEYTIPSTILVRFILDRFSSAKEAAEFIRDHVTVVFNSALIDMGYLTHYLIADVNDTFVIEFVDGETVVENVSKHPYITNFAINGVEFDSYWKVKTPYKMNSLENAEDTNKIASFGSGLERWNIIAEDYISCDTKHGMRAMLERLKYTHAYTKTKPEDIWYSEFVGTYNDSVYTVKTPYYEYDEAVIPAAKLAYTQRDRSTGNTWHTVHSSIYDIHEKKLYLVTQEDDPENEFVFPIEQFEFTFDSKRVKPNIAERVTKLENKRVPSIPDYPVEGGAGRVTALNGELIAENVVEAVGAPAYVKEEDVANFADFGITEAGWYVFARVQALENTKVGSEFSITGAEGYIAPAVGDNSVDVAVKFAVASVSKVVTINWGETTEKFIFRATDLAIRNLDYRVTYYLYDFSAYATFTFAAATGKFASGKKYFVKDGDEYVPANPDDIVDGSAIPEDTYYVHSGVRFEGFVRNVSYSLAETVDCPVTIVLPDIIDDKYGAWFEVQTTFDAAHSITLIAPTGVTISKDWTITPKAGVNVINAQYHAGSAMWRVNCTTWDAPHA